MLSGKKERTNAPRIFILLMRVFDWLDSESGSDRAHTVGGVPKHPLPHNHDKIYEIPVPSTSGSKMTVFLTMHPGGVGFLEIFSAVP